MRVYRKLVIINAAISFVFFVVALLLNYLICSDNVTFWIDICNAIFGGTILTVLTSVVSYYFERRKTLEGFLYQTRQILSFLSKYQNDMTLEEKLKFFIDYSELDKITWDTYYGDFDFFFEPLNKKRQYIYNKIYKPILDFNKAVTNHVWKFRSYFDGAEGKEKVMLIFVDELQNYLLVKEEKEIPCDWDENGKPVSFCRFSDIHSKLVLDVKKELAGHYYEILYGKRTAKRAMSYREKNENNQNAI